MKKTYILKIGGSVVTHKDGQGLKIRKNVIREIAVELVKVLKKKPLNLIIIHGAGSFGHRIAKKYNLQEGVGRDWAKWAGVVQTKLLCQELNLEFSKICAGQDLPVFLVQPAAVIINKNKKIKTFNLQGLKAALKNKLIPVLYGDVIFDEVLGASICSGDSMAAYLANEMNIEKIFFATDVAGIYTADPYINKKASLVEKVFLKDLFNHDIQLKQSHSTDVTGGIKGKLGEFLKFNTNVNLKEINIFNGLDAKNYSRCLLGIKFTHTKIKIEKPI